ncbi:hypothetical protein ACHAW6_016137 [Cyclotella cf. meneghiniana]
MPSQKNDKQSMGDLFMQQRRNRATSSAPSTNKLTLLSSGTSNTGDAATKTGKETRQVKSFADIQREQQHEKQKKQQQQQNSESNKDRTNSNTPKILKRPTQTNNSRNNPSRRASQDHTPTEQGVIHTLLEKFGFIHCADRPVELFFHYTSTNVNWDDLNIGDEVEFRVGNSSRRGSGEEDKLCALDVRVLPKNTIVWETEDVPDKRWRGVVDRLPGDRGREKIKGIIRLDEGEEEQGLEVTFASSDYLSKSSAWLGKADLVEFSMFTERRTGMKLARNIHLVRSERDRIREEREAKLLENATLERGVVVSDKGDFGFLRCVNRSEEVYYHVANLLVEGEEEGKRNVMKEGQEVEFHVVDESSLSNSGVGGEGGGKKKSSKSLSARKIKLLPKGTVKFERVLALGVTGVVVECPIEQGLEPFGSGGGRGDAMRGSPVMGRVRLEDPIEIKASDGEVVSEVILHPDLYPGGTFAMNRTGSEMGVWLRPGDILLFDVIQKLSDGSCKASPTKYTQTASLRPEGWTPDDSTKPAVRLVELALMGRTEGVVRSIRDDFAFIHCAERNVDAYMKLYEVFPNEMYTDLMLNSPELYFEKTDLTQKGGRIQLEVGMELSFDLSLQMLTNNSSGIAGRGGARNKQNVRVSAEKESLRARRALILPKGTIKEKISIAMGVRAVVTKDDPNQQFVGMLELEESIAFQTNRHRFPYITKLLDYISAGKYGEEVIFHDVLNEKDAQAVTLMVNASDELEWRYVPVDGESVEDSHHRKLCIFKRKKESCADRETPAVGNSVGDDSKMNEEQESSDLPHAEKAREAQGKETPSDSDKKKKAAREKVIKTVRYDKFSFPDLSICPLGVGDVITCDIFQSRNSGHIYVKNISVIDKKEGARHDSTENKIQANGNENACKKNLTGYVTEVVPSRQFGFITGLDENGSKTGDHVFFHFNVVNTGNDTPQDARVSSAKVNKAVKTDTIRKGDEVKFDAEPGKNGKLTATSISILRRGTLRLPSKVDTSTFCTGYILLEPSHTSLANTPSHIVLHSGPSVDGAGRWDNVGKEEKSTHSSGSNIKEEGVILLLTDPSHLFSPKPHSERKSSIDDLCNDTNHENGLSDEKAKSVSEDAAIFESAVFTHLRYKLSALAYRGPSNYNENRPDGPRRGDLVYFGKSKGNFAKDIRIERLDAATTVKGVLVDIKFDENTAVFISSDSDTKYSISLSEVVSCEKSLLREKQEVNGVLHNGKIFGVCRMKDIFLTSSLAKNSSGSNNGPKQRPKLNLTVKKELQGMGGQIMAQSKMAKGPDGTIGFVPGWTKRLSPNAKTFIPSTVQVSGFNSTHEEDKSGD